MSIAICIIAAVLELGAGGFLCFRGMREKKTCSRLLGVISGGVLACIAFFVFDSLSYDSQIGIITYLFAFAVCALAVGFAVWKYRVAIWLASFAALLEICLWIITFRGIEAYSLKLVLMMILFGSSLAVLSKKRYHYAVLVTFWGVCLIGVGLALMTVLSYAGESDVITAVDEAVSCLLFFPYYCQPPLLILAIAIGVVGICVQRQQRKKKGEIVDPGCEGEAADSGTKVEDEPESNETNTES